MSEFATQKQFIPVQYSKFWCTDRTSQDKTSYGTKRPTGQNVLLRNKTSQGQNVRRTKLPKGQNLPRDKMSQGKIQRNFCFEILIVLQCLKSCIFPSTVVYVSVSPALKTGQRKKQLIVKWRRFHASRPKLISGRVGVLRPENLRACSETSSLL